MSKQVIIPTAWILEMDDVGWDNGRDLRLIGQASRSGLPRHHAVEDYEFIRSLTHASGNHIATALCVADWDKHNILRGEVGITHDPHGWDRAAEMDPEKHETCMAILDSANADFLLHGVLHGRYDEEGKQLTEREFLVNEIHEDGTKVSVLPSEEDFRRRLDLFFRIYNAQGLKQTIRGFVVPCGVGNITEETVKCMAAVLADYGIRYWADVFKYPEFDSSLKVYNGVACFRWTYNKTKMPWEAYDIDPDTLTHFNHADDPQRVCLHGSHWTNYLRFNPKNNAKGIDGWVNFYKRQGEIFGSMNARDLAQAVNQLFYVEFATLSEADGVWTVDLSPVKAQALDCHKNEFFLSFQNGTSPLSCEGGEITLYETHNEFSTYKITHHADLVTIRCK